MHVDGELYTLMESYTRRSRVIHRVLCCTRVVSECLYSSCSLAILKEHDHPLSRLAATQLSTRLAKCRAPQLNSGGTGVAVDGGQASSSGSESLEGGPSCLPSHFRRQLPQVSDKDDEREGCTHDVHMNFKPFPVVIT